MSPTKVLLGLFGAFCCVGSAQAGMIANVNIQKGSTPLDTIVSIQDIGMDLKFTLQVDPSSTGNIGDLRGLFFDVANESLLAGLSVTGSDVSAFQKSANNVYDLGQGNNVSGQLVQDSKFDVGISFGSSGIGQNDIQTTMFTLSHTSIDLDANSFIANPINANDYVIAVRATSVGPAGGNRNGSSKTGFISTPVVPEPASSVVWLGLLGGLLRYRRRAY